MIRTQKKTPAIVGQGETCHRYKDLDQAKDPLSLMVEAVQRAFEDAGIPNGIALLDSLDVVAEYSWPYEGSTPQMLAERLGVVPARCAYGKVGGESPLRFIHEAALRIQRGECRVAVVVGAESEYFVQQARKAGVELNWPQRSDAPLKRGINWLPPLAAQLGVAVPPSVYPFFENATVAAWSLTPQAASEESARMWADFSQVAAANPNAWSQAVLTSEEVGTISPTNRLIAWPYPVRVIANPQVNQGAAILLVEESLANELHVVTEKRVYLECGAAAAEPESYLERANYKEVPAQKAVLSAVGAINCDEVELYSCFPVVPKMARRAAGMAADRSVTVTGGLSFFGAPLNNYMTHAVAAMVQKLRGAPAASRGLIYGQGGYACTHHALVLSNCHAGGELVEAYSVQAQADALRGAIPRFDPGFRGEAVLETHTTIFERDGQPKHGVVIARVGDTVRTLAKVPSSDTDAIAALVSPSTSAVGMRGEIVDGTDGLPEWRFAG